MMQEKDGRVHVSGPVTLENILELREQMGKYLRGPQCIVDFSGATEIDSAAVSFMFECLRVGKVNGTDVRFAGLGDSLSSLIDLYGVGDFLSSARA